MLKLFLILIMLSLSCSQGNSKKEYLSKYKLENPKESSLQTLARSYEVRRNKDNSFEVILPENENSTIYSLEPNAILLEQDISIKAKERNAKSPSYQELETQLKKMAQDFPEIASFNTYGTSDAGNPLFYLRISGKDDHFKPAVMVTGATHGDEKVGTDVVLLVTSHVLTNYGKVQRITDMVNKNEIYMIPVINADGYINNERYCAGLDPNRDYPYPEDKTHKPIKTIEAIIKFSHDKHIAGSLDYHCCGGDIMYPWAYTTESVRPEFLSRFKDIGNKMAASNHYTVGSISEIMYIAKGSSADYYFWKNLSLAYGVEVGSNAEENLESVLVYIENYFDK